MCSRKRGGRLIKSVFYFTYLFIVSAAFILCADFLYTNYIIRNAAELESQIELNLRVPNEHFMYGFKRNYLGPASWGGGRYKLATNSLGFRDAAPRTIEKVAEKPRLMFLGDSFTEGIGLEWPQTFAGKVARSRPDLEILNAGVASYSPRVYYKKLKWFIESGYKIDALWVFVDISDIHDEAQRSALFDGGQKPRRIDSAGPRRQEAEKQKSLRSKLVELLQRNFFLVHAGLRQVRKMLQKAYFLIGGDPSILRTPPWYMGLPRAEWTIGVYEDAFEPLGFQGSLELALRWMDRLHALAKANSIPLIVGVYPWPNQIHHNDRESRHVEIWRKWCLDKCRHFVNFFPVVFRAADDAHPFWLDELYLEFDIHFNERGNDVLARHILKRLEGLDELKAPGT